MELRHAIFAYYENYLFKYISDSKTFCIFAAQKTLLRKK